MKPFIKWVGGKTQIIGDVMDSFPPNIHNYHEVFVGGGSVLFTVLSRGIVSGKVCAYDLNGTLIAVYKNIQENTEKLHKHLDSLYSEYESCTGSDINRKPETLEDAKKSKENYYYWIRQWFNTNRDETPERSATFIFLNKMCFRGVYREGPNGFNVPFGHYKTTPTLISLEELYSIRALIKNVDFKHCDFREAFKNIEHGDFVYLDPPYAPETKTSFVGYTKDGFGLKDHQDLFELIKSSKVQFSMSNANVKLVTDTFSEYKIKEVQARRSINSKNPDAVTQEVIIYS